MSRAQLTALGLGRRAVEHRLATGRLHQVHRGAYLVGHRAQAPAARAMAAVLAAGDGSVLSHQSAAAFWGILRARAGPVEVTVVGREPRSRPGIRVHAVRSLEAGDRTTHRAVPITTPARTLLDIATRLQVGDLRWAIEEARTQRLVTLPALEHVVLRSSGRRGVARLRCALEAVAGAPTVTRSVAERKLVELVENAGLPPASTNVRVAGWSVDLCWAKQRVVAEIDGFAYHSSRTAFERDRSKDVALQSAGIHVIRLSWRQITEEPAAAVALLRRWLLDQPDVSSRRGWST